MTRGELLALAEQCIDGTAAMIDLAHAVARFRRVQPVEVMFGPLESAMEARLNLKAAETAARRGQVRVKNEGDAV